MDKNLETTAFDCQEIEEAYTCQGTDLGTSYSPDKTVFKVWAPGASGLEVLLYNQGDAAQGDDPEEVRPLQAGAQGVWVAEIPGDLRNRYYVYRVKRRGQLALAMDPYARAAGVNGLRGMIIDLRETDPPGFREQLKPPFEAPTDAIIYELHIRDLSVHPHSGIRLKGKFLGLTETNTKNREGFPTGLDHIRDLGVTHIHLLPCFDFKTIDERMENTATYNWGYDPQNYNLPEGSYATDPFDGRVRVRELKQLIQALHAQGLRVVLDVVYNHLYSAGDSCFFALVPGYYFRTDGQGNYTNGSGCGNETASERSMVRKFIIDSVCYWAREYRVDGFRFDLMGLHDIATMNTLRDELDRIDPSILVYGEGWTGGDSPLPSSRRAIKANAPLLRETIGLFSDDIRDGIKGSVFVPGDPGFVNQYGSSDGVFASRDEDIKFGIVGAVEHPAVDIRTVRYSDCFWAKAPSQTVNYASSHDNLSLWDKLLAANPGTEEAELLKMNKLAAAIVLTSQGIPFFQAGEEMARTKQGSDNSYNAPDAVNMLDWDRASRYRGLIAYYQGLIKLRKGYRAFRLRNAEEIRRRIRFLPTPPGLIAYTLESPDSNPYHHFMVIFNGLPEAAALPLALPQVEGTWDILVNGDRADSAVLGHLAEGTIAGKSALVIGMRG